jgi:Transposase DDE domain group 1
VNTNILGRASKFNIYVRETSLTAHAGIVLLKDFVERIELPNLIDLELCLKDRERGYPESENILALCWNLILGGDCLRDLNVLRGDAGLCELLNVRSILAPTSAGELLRQFDLGQIKALERVLRSAAERVRPLQTSTTVTMDLDSSIYVQCSKRKEGSRKAYNGQIGYQPLLCFWAEEGELLLSRLRSGNRNPAAIAEWFLAQVLQVAPASKSRYLRADSGFYTWPLIDLCKAEKIIFGITADLTKGLRAQIETVPEEDWSRFNRDAQTAELWYAPHQRAPHRYIVKRTRLVDKQGQSYWSYHCIITNDLRRSPKKLMKWFLKRCAMENLIKEHKHDFGLEKLPTQKFLANWAWFLIGQLAWNLVAWFKRLCLPKDYHTATVKTIRHRLFNVAGKIVHQARQAFLVLSDQYWFQDAWSFALKQLAKLQT